MGRGTVRSWALKRLRELRKLRENAPKISGVLALAAVLSLQSAAAQTKASNQNKAETYYLLVFSNPVAGQEAEYNRWYSDQHQQDVVSVPGFKTAQRFVLSDVQLRQSKPLPKYVIIYKIETADLGSVYAEVKRRIETGVTVISPAYDRANSMEFTYRAIRPLVFPRGSSSSGHKADASGAAGSRAEVYFQIVFSDATAGLEDEYNQWYDQHHELDVVSAPGFVEAQRFALSDIQLGNTPPLAKYLVIYKIVSDDIAARFADYRRIAPSMSESPAMGMSYGYTYRAMEPVIYGDQIRAERAKQKAAPGASTR
jgi:hypothetical protein